MSKTNISINENEVRAVSLEIRDQNDDNFEPTDAYASVVDEDNAVVVVEAEALITDNAISTLIDVAVTANIGTYYIIWKIVQSVGATNYVYYHKTKIDVMSV